MLEVIHIPSSSNVGGRVTGVASANGVTGDGKESVQVDT